MLRFLRRVGSKAGSALLALTACSSSDTAEPWPLAQVRVPSLSCGAAVEQLGECGRDADCGAGQVCSLSSAAEAVDQEPLRLRCGAPVGTGQARSPCADGSTCESGLCGLGGVCLIPCHDDDDCSLGQACQPVEVRIVDGLAPLQACARVAAFPEDVKLDVRTAGTLRSGQVNRVSVTTHGEVSLFFLKVDCARSLRVLRIGGPSGALFDLADQLEGTVQRNPVINEGALLPVLMPNNPRLTLGAAQYAIDLTIDDDAELTLISTSREKSGQTLDLNVFYVGGGSALQDGGLRPGAAEFRAVIDQLRRRYAALGIGLGEVQEFDVEGALRDELGELEVRSEVDDDGSILGPRVVGLDRLFELSAGVDNGGVNLFVVRSMGPVRGISGGTPGALGLVGTALSGVAIALDHVDLADADRVLFHEIGHQMGLFHTTERDGSTIEPLSDTPECGPENDRGDGVLHAEECAEHGGDNVMFWESVGDSVSPQQVAVLSGALILR